MGSEGGGACSVHPMCPTNLFNEELLAHGDTLVETLLEVLQHLLLLFHLPPQVAVRLQHHKLLVHRGLPRQLPQRIGLDLIAESIGPQKLCIGPSLRLTLRRSSIRPSFFSRSECLFLSSAVSFSSVSSDFGQDSKNTSVTFGSVQFSHCGVLDP